MDFSWIVGNSRLSFSHSDEGIDLHLKDGSRKKFSDFCQQALPNCRLNPLLFNGHMHTMWTAATHKAPALNYKRKLFEAESADYPGSFAVDFVVHGRIKPDKTLPKRTAYYSETELKALGSHDSKPMLVVLHGLAGGSSEIYLRHTLAPLVDHDEWAACVVNSRGCAGSKITSGILYNARATWDVRQVVKWLREKFPNRPLFGIGFSIGANILTNYIGEEGTKCVLKAALVLSNPWNLDASALALKRSWLGKEVYSKAMGASMKQLVEDHQAEIQKHTNINLDDVEKIKYLHEFDRVVQCPTYGYPTEEAYYRDASCADTLFGVKIPYLALHAQDDPICPDEAIPYWAFTQHPYAVLCTTSMGGHLGWFQYGGKRWYPQAVMRFLNKFAEDVCHMSKDEKTFPSIVNRTYHPMRRHLSY